MGAIVDFADMKKDSAKSRPATIAGCLGRGVLTGLGAGALVAVIATGTDWRQNPGGVFQGVNGNHWRAIAETAISWFWPVALVVTIVAVAVLLLTNRK